MFIVKFKIHAKFVKIVLYCIERTIIYDITTLLRTSIILPLLINFHRLSVNFFNHWFMLLLIEIYMIYCPRKYLNRCGVKV